MKSMALTLFLFFASVCAMEMKNTIPQVQTSAGKINGSLMMSRLGKQIFSFRGMRYAEPPVGKNRFKMAIPAKSWGKRIFNASSEGPACPQPGILHQSEDCLRLNVYTTKLPKDHEDVRRPVIVYFHPGSFYISTAQSSMVGPHYLMDQEIVLVTVNYRLGSLGFLSTGDELAPGNLGLKDQVIALRWVKNNIASFGGDPNLVTITGYGAGAWSVSLHLVSPMSKGLFHRAIAMSGSANYRTPLGSDQKHLAKKQAEFFGCPTDTTESILKCLRSKSAKEIVDTFPKFFEWYGQPILLWLPVIEPEIPGTERFLTGHPADLIRQGKFNEVPLIAGVTRDEFSFMKILPIEQERKGNDKMLEDLNANWTTIAPICFWYERNTSKSEAISESFTKFLLKNKPISLQDTGELALMISDAVIFQVHHLVKLMSLFSKKPVYYYKFSYQGRYSHITWSNISSYGVVHHDDLFYLFFDTYLNHPIFQEKDAEIKTVKRMTAIWENFAKTGEPIPINSQMNSNHPLFNLTWGKFSSTQKQYLEIGDEVRMQPGLIYPDRMNEWDKNFPLNQQDNSKNETSSKIL